MYIWLQIFLLVIQFFLIFTAAYLLLLTMAAWLGPRNQDLSPVQEIIKFIIIIPAHDEEHLLPNLLKNLESVDYPREHYSVHVVADNCTDNTAQIVQSYGATVYERTDEINQGKGYALQWALHNLRENNIVHDAIVIVDADSEISKNFLQVMAAHLAQGEHVIQSYYSVRNAEHSFAESIRYAALAVLHYLRPLGRMRLGGSAGLKGNGMVFDRNILDHHIWPTSITEDIEFHMELLLNGERVNFAPGAEVKAEMPETLTSTQSQARRWESGRLEMSRRYFFPLIQAAWLQLKRMNFRRAFVYFDALMEFIIPPFSILVGLSMATFMASAVIYAINAYRGPEILSREFIVGSYIAEVNLLLSIGILCAIFIYLISGLLLVKAPLRIYFALLQAPKYMLWKVKQYLLIFLKRKPTDWERTARNEG